ncbi:hypothetical protein D3C80_1572240 [compost metagenome]
MDMQLHGPVFVMIEADELREQLRAVECDFLRREDSALQPLGEDGFSISRFTCTVAQHIQRMVGQAAAVIMEEFNACAQRVKQFGIRGYWRSGCLFKCRKPSREPGSVNVQRLVRTEGREYAEILL